MFIQQNKTLFFLRKLKRALYGTGLLLVILVINNNTVLRADSPKLHVFTAYDGSTENGVLRYDVELLKRCLTEASKYSLNYELRFYKPYDISKSNEDEIIDKIKEIAKETRFEDVFLCYFSCHGIYVLSYPDGIKYTTHILGSSNGKEYHRNKILKEMEKSSSHLRILLSDACQEQDDIVTDQDNNNTTNPKNGIIKGKTGSAFDSSNEKEKYVENYNFNGQIISNHLNSLFKNKGFYDMYAASRGEIAFSLNDKTSNYTSALVDLLNNGSIENYNYSSFENFLRKLKSKTYELSKENASGDKNKYHHSTWNNYSDSRDVIPFMLNPINEIEIADIPGSEDDNISASIFTNDDFDIKKIPEKKGGVLVYVNIDEASSPVMRMELQKADVILSITYEGTKYEMNSQDDYNNLMKRVDKGQYFNEIEILRLIPYNITIDDTTQIIYVYRKEKWKNVHTTSKDSPSDLVFGATAISFYDWYTNLDK